MFEALRVPVVAADRSVDGGWASRSSRDHAAGRKTRGVVLADLTWPQAEAILTVDAVVVTPLGAAAKEHGPHLRLDNDLRLAQYLAARVVEASQVVLAPTIPYHFYPAFVEYPGSTHLSFDTARDLLLDIVRSLARHGPRRFYVLNTGISTIAPLQAAAERLAEDGILLRFTDLRAAGADARMGVERQQRGSHADEIETSVMLHIAPDRVDMTRAVRDDNPAAPGGLTRDAAGEGIFSPSGVWGDATLATPEKGRIVIEAVVAHILGELAALRDSVCPKPK